MNFTATVIVEDKGLLRAVSERFNDLYSADFFAWSEIYKSSPDTVIDAYIEGACGDKITLLSKDGFL